MGRIDGPGGCLGFGVKADGSLGGFQESSGHLADLVSNLVGCVIAIFHHLSIDILQSSLQWVWFKYVIALEMHTA